MQTVIYLLFFVFVAYLVKKLVIEPEVQLRKKIQKANEQKKELTSSGPKQQKNEIDFHGTQLLKNDPKKFLQNVEDNKQKLKRGEAIGVDAAQAFFLIRTSSHNGMIVGENGTINMRELSDATCLDDDDERLGILRKEIMEYQPADRDQSKIKTFHVPGYVKEVVSLKDGIVRWVYEDWHVQECGVKSICFDKHSRLVKDPDEQDDDKKVNLPKRIHGQEKMKTITTAIQTR